MRTLRNERGIVMIAALGIIVALAGLSLVVTSSGQMSTITGALHSQASQAFYTADGAAYYALGEQANFVPDMPDRYTNHTSTSANLDATVKATYLNYRALPGNLLIRTTDGKVRPAQFGQGEGLGKMYYFELDATKNTTQQGLDPMARVVMRAAKPGPCADCGS